MTGDLFTTFDEAEQTSAYELARRWCDRTAVDGDPVAEIDELATMAALAVWLQRWLPTQIHRTLMAGATVAEVEEASGLPRQEVYDLWSVWVRGQLDLRAKNPSMDFLHDLTAEFHQVDARFVAALS